MSNNIEFKELILKNLNSNGFPQKKVSLPLEKMYEMAELKQVNLNTILKELEDSGIMHEKDDDKIIFCQITTSTATATDSAAGNFSPEMMQKAQEMMGKMTPEQIKQAEDMLQKMTSTDKDDLMKKAKDMGFM